MSPLLPPTSLPFLVTNAVAWTPSTGPHDMIYQPCLLLYAIFLPAVAFPLCLPVCCSVSSILDRRCALRIFVRLPYARSTLRFVQGRPSVYGAYATVHTVLLLTEPIRREGNGSRERRLMRSRVSLAELFHEIRVSIYESRSRRFLSLGIGRTFIIFRERIRIKVENKKKFYDISHFYHTLLNESNCKIDQIVDSHIFFY